MLFVDPFVDGLTDDNPFMDVHLTSSGIIIMNQGFMIDIQNNDQIQAIHNNNIGMNPEFGGGFQYQDHLQRIQRNLEGFQNSGFMVENQQILLTTDINFTEPMFIFGLANQDHAQLIPNNNSTTGFDSLSPRAIVVGSGSGSTHALSRETIVEHFNKTIKQAAKELNVGTTQLKKCCRELGIKR